MGDRDEERSKSVTNIYKNPPLVEALCEFRFNQSSPWDVTIFGNYYNRIQEEFPEKRQLQEVEMSLQDDERGITGGVKGGGIRMQFMRSDHSAMVQLAPHRLIINKLAPYESWAVFKTLVQARLSDYQHIVEQALCQRVSLRYINRFDFPRDGFTVGTYYGQSDIFPPRLYQAGDPFFLRLEIPEIGETRLLITMGTIEPEKPARVSVLLDIDYVMTEIPTLNEADLLAHLDQAHDQIEAVFESCLTDTLRSQFNPEVQIRRAAHV